MPNHAAHAADIKRRADALAQRLPLHDGAFADAGAPFDEEYRQLLNAVRALDARFAFDRDGRPAAVDAVREALPAMERDLFDAVLDDHACELAAIEEALFQLAQACRRQPR
jgi:hypothetical protein